jgi:hypothetical protein
MAAYTTALGKIADLARKKPVSGADAKRAEVRAVAAAKACGAAEKQFREAEHDLVACGFAVNPCSADKVAAAAKSSDDARASAEDAWHTIAVTTSTFANSRAAVEKAKQAAGCVVPSWR